MSEIYLYLYFSTTKKFELRVHWNLVFTPSNLWWYLLHVIRLSTANKPLISWFCHHRLCYALEWRHNGHDGVSNHLPNHCLLNRLFTRRSKKTSKLRVTGLCAGNSPVTGEFPAQMAINAGNVSIW